MSSFTFEKSSLAVSILFFKNFLWFERLKSEELMTKNKNHFKSIYFSCFSLVWTQFYLMTRIANATQHASNNNTYFPTNDCISNAELRNNPLYLSLTVWY